MSQLRFMMIEASSPETQPEIAAYAERLYRARYRRLGWRSKPGDSSDTKLLRDTVVGFMVMDVRDRKARARAARLGRAYIGIGQAADPSAVDPQLATLALSTAVQEGDGALFDHLLALLEASTDATMRNRILIAMGAAEAPALSARALDLTLDPKLRRNETPKVLANQLRNPRTRDRAWAWLKENFDAFAERIGHAQAGSAPWYAASLCTREAADDVQAFFEPRVSTLVGGPRNLAGAVEAIRLCAAKAEAQRPNVDEAFRRP
jgi:alanyl aminopeptidase